jgi:hypothetical protein
MSGLAVPLLDWGRAGNKWDDISGPGMASAGVRRCGVSKFSKLLNQENALSAPCLQHVRSYCGAIKVARFGFP